jgi:hypothetical protein
MQHQKIWKIHTHTHTYIQSWAAQFEYFKITLATSKYTRSIFYLGQIALKQANYIIKSKEWGVLLPEITFSQKESFELIF